MPEAGLVARAAARRRAACRSRRRGSPCTRSTCGSAAVSVGARSEGPAPSMRAASSSSGGIVFSAPYMMTIQPPAPVQNAIIAKMKGRFPGAIDSTKRCAAEHVAQQERAGADRRVEHEQPDQDRRRAGQRARNVEEEAVRRRDTVRAPVQQQRQADDEHHQRAEPDARVHEDVLERRDEAEVVDVRVKLSKPAQPPRVVREGELERVDRRQRCRRRSGTAGTAGRTAGRAARAGHAVRVASHVLRGRGRRAQVASLVRRPCTRPPSRCSRAVARPAADAERLARDELRDDRARPDGLVRIGDHAPARPDRVLRPPSVAGAGSEPRSTGSLSASPARSRQRGRTPDSPGAVACRRDSSWSRR